MQRFFTFAIFAFLSKYFSSIEYGNYVYIILIIGLSLELSNSGLFQGVQNEISRTKFQVNERCNIISASYFSTTFIVLINIFVVCIIYFSNRSNIYQIYSTFELVLFIGGFIISSSFFSLGNIILIGSSNVRSLFISNLIQGILSLVFIIILFTSQRQNAVLVLFSLSLSYFITIIYQIFVVKPIVSFKYLYVKKLFNKGRWFVLWSLVSVLESRADSYLLSSKISLQAIAIFDIATKFLILGQLITSTLSQRYIPEILSNSELEINSSFRLRKTTISFIPILFFLILPVSLFINVYYQGRYDKSIFCFGILTIGMCFNLLNILNTTKIIKYGAEKYLFILMTISLLIKLPIAFKLISEFDVFGASISSALSQFITFVIFYFFTNHYILNKWKAKN